ncbi:MAG: PilZ domain-containing protein [Planctomycetota bacterium]
MKQLAAQPESVTKDQWSLLTVRADLPCSPDEYFDQSGPLKTVNDTRRRFHRIFLRSVAVIWNGETALAGYARDVSRMGVGIYSPVQLFPGDIIHLGLPGKPPISLEITRCIRRRERCYECGSVFRTATTTNP